MYTKVVTIIAIMSSLTLFWQYSHRGISVEISNTAKEKISQYSYINTAKVVDVGKHYIIDFSDLRKKLNIIVDKQKSTGNKTYIYFNYLNNGSWIGINEREEFTAASLLKVPLAMATYKAVEEKKILLTDQYTISGDDLDSNFGELYKSGLGKTFTVEELLKIMLEKSDNTAMKAIGSVFQKIGITDMFQDVYSNLGWEFLPSVESGADLVTDNYKKISLKVLSNMFLALYNAQYLNMEHSQAILENLANTNFKKQIEAGVPDNVPVSDKIGVGAGINVYSDCGIVYAPGRNYLLCLGSEGANEEKANAFMKEVSGVVYDYVIKN